MIEKEVAENKEIQHWSIIKINSQDLPVELKNIKSLDTEFRFEDYKNRNVFEINEESNIAIYPALYNLVSHHNLKWKSRFLILQKQITPETQAEVNRMINKAADLLEVLINKIKESTWKGNFYTITQEYSNEIGNIFKDDSYHIMDMFWDIAEYHNQWEITEQDIDELLIPANLLRYKTPENNTLCYIQWSPIEIEQQKNKLLDNWSNIFLVQ